MDKSLPLNNLNENVISSTPNLLERLAAKQHAKSAIYPDISKAPLQYHSEAFSSEISFNPTQMGKFEQVHPPLQSKKRGLHQISDPITSPKRVEINRRLKFDTWPKSAQFLNNKNMMDEFLNLKIFVKAQYDQIHKLQQHTNST